MDRILTVNIFDGTAEQKPHGSFRNGACRPNPSWLFPQRVNPKAPIHYFVTERPNTTETIRRNGERVRNATQMCISVLKRGEMGKVQGKMRHCQECLQWTPRPIALYYRFVKWGLLPNPKISFLLVWEYIIVIKKKYSCYPVDCKQTRLQIIFIHRLIHLIRWLLKHDTTSRMTIY